MKEMSGRGSCAGYELVTTLPFRTLRDGTGTPMTVTSRPRLPGDGEVLIEWSPRPDNPFHGRLVRDGDLYRFWASDAGWYEIDARGLRIAMTDEGEPIRRELRMFGIPAALCTAALGDVSVHAAAVGVDGAGVLIAGPSRYGKTTLAAGFAAAGHRLLTEDTTRCDPARLLVYPGPAAVRLRADVARHVRIAGAQEIATNDEGRVTLALSEAARGTGDPLPLALIVIVREPTDTLRLETVRPADAARDLMALTFRLPDVDGMRTSFERVAAMAAQVKIVALHRPMTFAEMPSVIDRIAHEASRIGSAAS